MIYVLIKRRITPSSIRNHQKVFKQSQDEQEKHKN